MSYTMSAQIIGDKELKDLFNRSPQMVAKELGNAIEKTARQAEGKAKQLAPAQFGDLRRSIETKGPFITSSNIMATVSTDKNYARYQEEGTGIEGPKGQMITPKNGRVLAWKSGGKMVYARQSRGTAPKWYMRTAREDARPMLTEYARVALGKIISFLAK